MFKLIRCALYGNFYLNYGSRNFNWNYSNEYEQSCVWNEEFNQIRIIYSMNEMLEKLISQK